MNFEPKSLKLWTRPESYGGELWPNYYVFLGQNRDSDALTRSNFICGLNAIGGESETVIIVRERHWAVGWVEWIAIHADDEKALELADEVACALSDYPVVSDDHFSELEYTEASDYWARLSIKLRAEYCKECGISIFSARRDYLPADPTGALLESLKK
jgi:hypothetical protein